MPAFARDRGSFVTRDGQRDENLPSDRALYVTTAFSGLGRRGELLALRWRAVDFDQQAFRVVESCGQGELSWPKSGRACTVPMVEQVDKALTKPGGARAPYAAAGPRLPRLGGRLHGLVGAAPPLRSGAGARRSARAGLPDLRHTFGSLAINYASIVPV